MEHFPDVDAYIESSHQWQKQIEALRTILLDCGLEEQIKWGKPCYSVDGSNVVIIQEFSDSLSLMFFKGILLDDPAAVLEDQGPNSHAAKRMTFTSVAEVEDRAEVVRSYVAEAVAVERAGTPLPPPSREPLAAELQERLAGDPHLAEALDELTPGRRREYNLHVSGAKQASTRERRIDEIVPRILAGKGLRDR